MLSVNHSPPRKNPVHAGNTRRLLTRLFIYTVNLNSTVIKTEGAENPIKK